MNERTCSAPEGCTRTDVVGYDGLCRKHYHRKRRHGTTELPDRAKPPCSAPECGKPSKTRDLCVAHYSRLLKTGSTQEDKPVRPRERDASATEKACSACGAVKPLIDFAPDNRRRDGRQARCRECVKEYQKRYRQDNRERYLELKRAEVQRGKERTRAYVRANAARINARQRARIATLSGDKLDAYRERHRRSSSEYRSRNPEVCNERIRAWGKANPDKRSHYMNLRRARKRQNGPSESFTRSEIGDRDGWTCGICERPVDKTLRAPDPLSPSLDHIVPLALGGTHTRANSRITHLTCNVRRNIGRAAA